MEIRELHENWKMRRIGDLAWQEAIVPGTVYTYLLRNQNMKDPYWKDQEDQICALMEEDYEYVCTFSEEDTGAFSDVFLRFEGLDTVAEVYLNGQLLGKPLNMHRVWAFHAQSLLRTEENILRVIFLSPLKYIAEAHKKYERFITVKAKAYAKSVEIQNEAEDLVLSDNYFDLNGDSKTVEILRGELKNVRIRSVYDIR